MLGHDVYNVSVDTNFLWIRNNILHWHGFGVSLKCCFYSKFRYDATEICNYGYKVRFRRMRYELLQRPPAPGDEYYDLMFYPADFIKQCGRALWEWGSKVAQYCPLSADSPSTAWSSHYTPRSALVFVIHGLWLPEYSTEKAQILSESHNCLCALVLACDPRFVMHMRWLIIVCCLMGCSTCGFSELYKHLPFPESYSSIFTMEHFYIFPTTKSPILHVVVTFRIL